MSDEAMIQFLARGGKITKCKPGREKYDHSAKYRKDRKLQELYKLRRIESLTDEQRDKVEIEIQRRIAILKCVV